MKAKSEEACGMRVESLKKDAFKKDNMQNKKMQEKSKATINMFLLMIPGHFWTNNKQTYNLLVKSEIYWKLHNKEI